MNNRIQVKKLWENHGQKRMHIQGVGKNDGTEGVNNRPYGISIDFNVTPTVLHWLEQQEGQYPSAYNLKNADAPLDYIQAHLCQNSKGDVGMYIEGEYTNVIGGAFVILKADTPACEFLLTFCSDNDILRDGDDAWPVDDDDAGAQDDDTAPA